MLTHLHIRNFAIVDQLDLEFAPGMTVLSGETGAGKSILLDALGLTLGDRADSTVVGTGGDRAEVTAAFTVTGLPAVEAWLQEHELDSGSECLIRRTLSADGRSKAYVNGQPVPVQSLRELGEALVDIHGQHAHQSLLRREVQRDLLDGFGGHQVLAAETLATYGRWEDLEKEFSTLRKAREERESRMELLRYQIGELEALNLGQGELSELEEEHGRLANAARLQEASQRAAEVLYESDEGAVVSLLGHTLSELRELQAFDHALDAPCELIESALIQAKEAASEVRRYVSALEIDPARLAEVEQRLAGIHDLARKHRLAPEELPAHLEQLREEFAGLEAGESRLEGLQQATAEAREHYQTLAGELSLARGEAAARLAAEVTANMKELGMGGGTFEVNLESLPEVEWGAAGMERIEFYVSANPGQPPRPLAKVASGGELSRISLSIQVISAGTGGIPTLVFDEVDVGVGGAVAEMVGRQLRRLGSDRQVLCVTHQPQVASQGHHHLRIEKESSGGTTRTRVTPVVGEARVEELARMSGGLEITEQALSHAWEMLARAQQEGNKQGQKTG